MKSIFASVSSFLVPVALICAAVLFMVLPSCQMPGLGGGYDYQYQTPPPMASAMPAPQYAPPASAPAAGVAAPVVSAPHPTVPGIIPTGNPIVDIAQLLIVSAGPIASFIAGSNHHRKIIYAQGPSRPPAAAAA